MSSFEWGLWLTHCGIAGLIMCALYRLARIEKKLSDIYTELKRQGNLV